MVVTSPNLLQKPESGETGNSFPIITRTISATREIVTSLVTRKNLQEISDASLLLSSSIETFEHALSALSNTKDRKSLIQAHRLEINRLADDGTIDQLIFFLHAYKERKDFSLLLPPLEEVVDLSHTQVFLAMIFEQSKKKPRVEHINSVIKKALETCSIADLLSSARCLKNQEFEKFYAFEIVRSILRDGAVGNDFIDGGRYEDFCIERENEWNLYRMFKRKKNNNAITAGERVIVEKFYPASEEDNFRSYHEDEEFLPTDDPLITTLWEIADYNPDIYESIISRMKDYNKLQLTSYFEFKNIVLQELNTVPANVKAAYKSKIYTNTSDPSLPRLTFDVWMRNSMEKRRRQWRRNRRRILYSWFRRRTRWTHRLLIFHFYEPSFKNIYRKSRELWKTLPPWIRISKGISWHKTRSIHNFHQPFVSYFYQKILFWGKFTPKNCPDKKTRSNQRIRLSLSVVNPMISSCHQTRKARKRGFPQKIYFKACFW